ncbi:MAG: hypothetical protein V3S49_06195 [Thermodesulfobacteriota bacterium]
MMLIKMQKKEFIVCGMVSLFASYLLLLCAPYALVWNFKTSDITTLTPLYPSGHRRVQAGTSENYIPLPGTGQSFIAEPVPANYAERIKEAVLPESQQEEIFAPLDSKREVRAARNEGTLWIDRRRSQSLITLGRRDGLKKGMLVDIYDGERQVGQARVTQVFDVISYAEFVGKTQEHFRKNHYRINIL